MIRSGPWKGLGLVITFQPMPQEPAKGRRIYIRGNLTNASEDKRLPLNVGNAIKRTPYAPLDAAMTRMTPREDRPLLCDDFIYTTSS